MTKQSQALETLKPILFDTPLIRSSYYSHISSKNIYFKPENLQRTGSFKIRGAYNKIANLSPGDLKKGVVTSSAGNHAQGVAYAAKKLGINATIVMPNTTPLLKVRNVKEFGAEVILTGDVYDESYAFAVDYAKTHNKTFVHPFDDEAVIEGQGTIATEILEQNPEIDTIVVPVGGGGLIAGIAKTVKAIAPSVKVIGVEPEGAASMKASIEQGRVVELNKLTTTAEGVAVREVGKLTYDLVQQFVDELLTVSEEQIMESILVMIEKHKLVVEAAGVVGLAALDQLPVESKNVAILLSGGNIDTVTLASVVNRGMIKRGRIMSFSVELPDKAGQLLAIASILTEEGANVIALNHDQFKVVDRYSNKVVLEVVCETNSREHIASILEHLHNEGFNPKQIY
jgi:threonine dehydratase